MIIDCDARRSLSCDLYSAPFPRSWTSSNRSVVELNERYGTDRYCTQQVVTAWRSRWLYRPWNHALTTPIEDAATGGKSWLMKSIVSPFLLYNTDIPGGLSTNSDIDPGKYRIPFSALMNVPSNLTPYHRRWSKVHVHKAGPIGSYCNRDISRMYDVVTLLSRHFSEHFHVIETGWF